MESLLELRLLIKSYFPESSELQLSSHFDSHRRYNFYFEIIPDTTFLLYLNWDGHGDIFVLKCLEFTDSKLLNELKKAYTNIGAKAFNVGQPRTTISFRYPEKDRLTNVNLKGIINDHVDSSEISGDLLMGCIDPFKKTDNQE